MNTQTVRCAGCKTVIRVPRNMGLMRVTCPLCKYEFPFNSDVTATYNDPGSYPPGLTARTPEKKPSKKGGGGRRWFAFLALLLIVFVAASALRYGENSSAPVLPTLSVERPSATPPSSAGTPAPTVPVNSPSLAPALPTNSPAVTPTHTSTPTPRISAYERAGEVIPYLELRYFLSRLDDAELDVICTLYEAAMNYEESCAFEKRVDKSTFNQVVRLLEVECPELFQLDYRAGFAYRYDRTTQEVTSCELPYLLTNQSQYEEMRLACERVIGGFAAETKGFTDYEKEKYVFDYISSNCRYNDEAADAHSPYAALVSFEAKCSGFSAAMTWSMEALGIQCLNIWADSLYDDTAHAWNLIRLDGSYYMVDATASVHQDWKAEAGIDEIIYFAFNVPSAMNAKYEIRDFYAFFAPVPVCYTMDASYYARTGHFVPAAADPAAVLAKELEGLAAIGGGAAYIQFESAEDFESFCGEACSQALRDWLENYGKPWSYTWWDLNYNVLMVKVTW